MVHRSFLVMQSVWIGLMSACAMSDAQVLASSDTVPGTDLDTGVTSTSSGEGITLDGYALSGELTLDAAGEAIASLQLTTLTTDGDVACDAPLELQLAGAELPPDEDLLAWWDVTIDADGSLCGAPASLFTSIGIGAWDDRLDAALLQQGYDEALPFGLYLQASSDQPVWIVGLAATEAQLSGEQDAQPPLTDGRYTIAFLVQTPWPNGG